MVRPEKLRHRDDEARRKLAPRRPDELGHEEIERPQAADVQLVRHRLDPNADEWRQRVRLESFGNLARGGLRVCVFLRVRSVPVAIFEIDAKVFDRLVAELAYDARSNRLGERGAFVRSDIELQRVGEGPRVRRVLLERGEREIAEPAGRVRAKQLRTAVDRVNGLTPFDFAWPGPRRRAIAAPESGGNPGECWTAQRRSQARHG